MKLVHDIENDLEHTIPPEGGPDSQWLFRAMTERALAHTTAGRPACIVDLASGMGQDTLALARLAGAEWAGQRPAAAPGAGLAGLWPAAAPSAERAGLWSAGAPGPGAPPAPGTGAPPAPCPGPLVIGIEPSNRMIRFGQTWLLRRAPGLPPGASPASPIAPGASPAGGSPALSPAGASPAGASPPELPASAAALRPRFLRGLGEELPLRSESVDALLCKGALDHFMDPALTLREIARVLRPGGRAVIALANYGSLSCRLGRWRDRGRPRPAGAEPPYYEPPPDHLTRFTHASIVALAQSPLRVRAVEGLSLLWGFPPWGRLLQAVPAALQRPLLGLAGGVARWRPAWADVVVLVAEKAAPAREA